MIGFFLLLHHLVKEIFLFLTFQSICDVGRGSRYQFNLIFLNLNLNLNFSKMSITLFVPD